MKTIFLLLLSLTAAISLSRAADREAPFRVSPGDPDNGKVARLDYSQYRAIPNTPTCYVFRKVQKAIPYTRHRAFWGHWAGSGSEGGKPVDEMDEIFRRHDIVYGEAKSLRTMRWADAACVEALQKLDTCTMSPEAIAFRNRSSKFFSNRRLAYVGKPVRSYFCYREERDCPFQSEDDVREAFGLGKIEDEAPAPAAVAREGKWLRMKTTAKNFGRKVSASSRRPVIKVRGWYDNVRIKIRGA